MSTQQDIYAAGSENRPPMLNKDNYVPWYSHHEVPVAETFHEQTDDELTEKEVKQMEADDQAIQIILMGLPEDIYDAVDSCETAQEIWLRVQHMMKEEHYTELFEPIPEPHQVQHNDSNVISAVSSVEQSEGTVEQHPAAVEETSAYFESLYNNLAIEVEKVNTVNRKMKETNADLTTEIARYKNQEKCFEINQEKYDKLERCYQKSVYQEQCLTKKINVLHLNSAKTITTLNEEIANLNNQLSKEKSIVSFLNDEKKKLKSDFKIREEELLDKQIQLENKINELDNILVFVSQKAKSREELYFSNTSKMAIVSKSISIPNEEFTNDTTSSVARKFLNGVKSTIVTLQRVVKQKMTLDIHNWSSSSHQEILKIVKDEIYPIVNQVDARVQNFEIQFLKEEAKFVQDYKSLANEADESLAKHKALEFEIERLLRAVVSQDIMSIVQNPTVVETSDIQTELEPYNDMQQKIKRLQAQLGDQKGKSEDTSCVLDTLEPLSQKLENKNVSKQKDTTHGTSVNTKFTKQSILEKLPSSSKSKLYSVTPFPKSKLIPKVGDSDALSNPV
ncbi:hypothetical protein Tco_0903738, partial [Tanacetum coccineum]